MLRFEGTDEIGTRRARNDLRGQFLYDFTDGVIRARPVTFSSVYADRNQTLVGCRTSAR